jgi:hypothetical protein
MVPSMIRQLGTSTAIGGRLRKLPTQAPIKNKKESKNQRIFSGQKESMALKHFAKRRLNFCRPHHRLGNYLSRTWEYIFSALNVNAPQKKTIKIGKK